MAKKDEQQNIQEQVTAEVQTSVTPSAESKEQPEYVIIEGKTIDELTAQINDLKAKQPEGASLAASPIARDAFGIYIQRIDFIKK